jgi:hypothetical protein
MNEDPTIRLVLTAQVPSSVAPRRLLSEIARGLSDAPGVASAEVAHVPWSRQVENPAPTAASADWLVSVLAVIRMHRVVDQSDRVAIAAVHRHLYACLRAGGGAGVAALAAAPLNREQLDRFWDQATHVTRVGQPAAEAGADVPAERRALPWLGPWSPVASS